MGLHFMDRYSYLHFAVGIVCYYWNIGFITSVALHTIFEILENTPEGMNFINKYLPIWPGGKPYSDSFVNMFGDTVFFILGYITADMIAKLDKNYP